MMILRLSNNAQTLIRRASRHGLYFDKLESYKGALRFFTHAPNGAVYFSSWKELRNYLRGLCD